MPPDDQFIHSNKPFLFFLVEFMDEEHETEEINIRGIYGSKTSADAEWELNFIFSHKTVNVQPDPPIKLKYE